MRIQLKSTIILSLTVLITAACARQNDSYVVTDTTPSPNTYSYSAATASSGQTPVTHSHSGKVHTHLLPASGLIHTHTAAVVNTSVPAATAPAPVPVYNPRPVYRPPATTRSYNYAPPRYAAPVQRYTPAPRYAPSPAPRYAPPAPVAQRYTYTPRPAPVYVAPRPTTPPQRRPVAPSSQYNYENSYNSYNTTAPTPDYSYTGSTVNPPASIGGVNDYNYTGTTAAATNGNSTATNVDSYTGANTSYYAYNGATTEVDDYAAYSRPKATTSYANPSYDYSVDNTAGTTGASSSYYSDYGISGSGKGATTTPSSINSYSGSNSYTVQRGDTVFQVMRNTGVYWKDIIKLNDLRSPAYTIKPGQVLRLK